MSLIPNIASPVFKAQNNQFEDLTRIVHTMATFEGGRVLSFNCLNELILNSSE